MIDEKLRERVAELKRQMSEAQRLYYAQGQARKTADYGKALRVMDDIEREHFASPPDCRGVIEFADEAEAALKKGLK